jgi:HEPN domain-containing protein
LRQPPRQRRSWLAAMAPGGWLCRGNCAILSFIYQLAGFLMGLGYKKADLCANATSKLHDAILLFENGRPSNAFYLAGYAIEIGIKACIAAQISHNTVPSKEILKGFLEHDFRKLVGLAGLAGQLKEKQRDVDFNANWAIVCEWSPDSRYDDRDKTSAQTILEAIKDEKSGVFEWIKACW